MARRQHARLIRLNKTVVDNLVAEPDRKVRYWSEDVKGFGVFVHPSGEKSYFIQYRRSDGAQRCPIIGQHGAITYAQALDVAKKWLGLVANGIDPAEERKAKRTSITLTDFSKLYIRDYATPYKKKSRSTRTRSI